MANVLNIKLLTTDPATDHAVKPRIFVAKTMLLK